MKKEPASEPLPGTAKIISAALDADGGITPAHRRRIMEAIATGPAGAPAVPAALDGFYTPTEAAKLCVPHMPAGGSMLSMTYLGSGEVVPNYGVMGPVKAALESLVRYMSMELGPQNIRVHAVSPGPILTRASSGIAEFDQLMATAQAKAPLQRLVTLEEIAQLSAFLCMDAAGGMSGQTIYVDGGVHAMD